LVSGLRVADVNFLRGVVHPAQQWPDKPLKTDGSAQPIPIPQDLALLLLSASVQKCPSDMMVANGAETDRCGPWIIERAIRDHVHRAPFAGARLVRSSGQLERMGDPAEVHFVTSLHLRCSLRRPIRSPFTSPRRAVLCNLLIWLQVASVDETCQGGYL
jgi:hypothetical protein